MTKRRADTGDVTVGPRVAAADTGKPGEPAHFDLQIRSLPLGQALQELARQGGIQILFFSKLAAGLRSPELVGNYTLSAAMDRLLSGSGLSFRILNLQPSLCRTERPSFQSEPMTARHGITPPSSAI